MILSSPKKDIMLIHGAWSTTDSFNYITSQLPKKKIGDIHHFNFDCIEDPIDTIHKKAALCMQEIPNNTIIISHSLGGLVALSLHNHQKCDRIVTIASPLSGIHVPSLFRPYVYSRAPILKDIRPSASFVTNVQKQNYTKPILCVIASRGVNPLMEDDSDGVITIETQSRWLPSTAKTHDVPRSHYEVLQSENTIKAINRFLEE